MLRQEDLIKHSNIIEYLEERIKYHENIAKICYTQQAKDTQEQIIIELKYIIKHFKEEVKDD